jgi:hypothetical protein
MKLRLINSQLILKKPNICFPSRYVYDANKQISKELVKSMATECHDDDSDQKGTRKELIDFAYILIKISR